MASAGVAMANQIQVGYDSNGSASGGVSSYGPYQTGIGGEITYNDLGEWLDYSGYASVAKNQGYAGITSFQSFCIERTETVSGYSATYNAQLSTSAIFGSVGAAGDPVSQGTGWLYSQFATANWEGGLSYDYTNPGRSGAGGSADLLQQALWWLEDETSNINASGSNNPYTAAAVSKFGSVANARGGTALDYGVYAVNMWTGSDPTVNRAQDSLFYVGVPDGGKTLVLLGLAISGLAAASRRSRKG